MCFHQMNFRKEIKWEVFAELGSWQGRSNPIRVADKRNISEHTYFCCTCYQPSHHFPPSPIQCWQRHPHHLLKEDKQNKNQIANQGHWQIGILKWSNTLELKMAASCSLHSISSFSADNVTQFEKHCSDIFEQHTESNSCRSSKG